jgi:hypothetical protein
MGLGHSTYMPRLDPVTIAAPLDAILLAMLGGISRGNEENYTGEINYNCIDLLYVQ